MASVVHGLQLVGVGDLVAGLVLGQDLHERPQLQPPLLFGDPVPADGRKRPSGPPGPGGRASGRRG